MSPKWKPESRILNNALTVYCLLNQRTQIAQIVIYTLIIYMKKLLDSHWLRAVQFKCNASAKSVTPVQKV